MMLHTLLRSIHENNLFSPDDTVIVAVSGGTDSIALLHLLATTQPRPATLHAVSLNHGLRGDAAAADVAYVQRVAQQLNVPITTGQVNTPQIAEHLKLSIEAAARKARYDFLAQVAHEQNANIIVTAHHADDQAETILMNIIRGTGIKGLTGMCAKAPVPYHPDLTLVRPLLTIRRAELEAYCAEHTLQPRHDATNDETDYFRNAIRLQTLPHLKQHNPQIIEALTRLGDIITVEQDFMLQHYQQTCESHIEYGSQRTSIPLDIFRQWHEALQRQTILMVAQHHQSDVEYTHIQSVIDLVRTGQVGQSYTLPNNIRARIGYDELHIERRDVPLPTADYFTITRTHSLNVNQKHTVESWNLHITDTKPITFDAYLAVPENASLQLRTRSAGDRFKPFGLKGKSQKLKKWLIDHKIPQHIRDQLPLLIINDEIAAIIFPNEWIISHTFAVIVTSQRILYFSTSKI